MANRNVFLKGTTLYNGEVWNVLFAYLKLKRGWKPSVIFKNPVTKERLVAPRDSVKMLQIWDIEFWPEFARSLANPASDDSNQLELFKEMK